MKIRIARLVFSMIGLLLFVAAGFYVTFPLAELLGWELDLPYALAGIGTIALLGFFLGYMVALPALTAFRGSVGWLEGRLQTTPLSDIVAGVLGIVFGLIIANLLRPALAVIPWVGDYIPTLGFLMLGYLGYLVALKKKDDILSVLTFLPRPSRQGAGVSDPTCKLLDTSAIIDGRIAGIQSTGFLEGTTLVPRFVLEELRHIADSDDSVRRNRGRRGLDILRQMQEEQGTVEITNRDPSGEPDVDAKLVRLARDLGAAIITTDFNLNKVAQLQGVTVLNINDLANALKPPVLPGEKLKLTILREGKESGQGVGYLEDGTMVVVENARRHVGRDLLVSVTSVLQTAAGRMVFARPENGSSEKVTSRSS